MWPRLFSSSIELRWLLRVFPITILLRIIACKVQYFPSIFLYFNQYQVKLFIDRLCMFPELNDLLHKQQNFSIFMTDVKVTFHLKMCVNWKQTVIQGVSVKVTFSPSMSQGLNLIKYWWSMTLFLPRHGRFCYLTETFM